jgi:hypothetical protein
MSSVSRVDAAMGRLIGACEQLIPRRATVANGRARLSRHVRLNIAMGKAETIVLSLPWFTGVKLALAEMTAMALRELRFRLAGRGGPLQRR